MSWVESKIGDLYKVGSSKRVLKSEWKKEGIPFYRGREISTLSKLDYVENELYISEDMYKSYADNYGVPGADDIMITAIGTIGNTYIVKENDKFYFKDASVLWLKKDKLVNANFINYWFKSKQFYEQLGTGLGATVDTLTIGKVQGLKIRLPSLPTQQKIVAKLDAIFAEVDKATAAAEANAKNAEALFQSYLTEVFERGGEGWIERLTGDICTKITDGKHGDCVNEDNSGYYFLSAKDIKNGNLNYKGSRQITRKDFEETHRRTNLECGDVLVTNSGTIGRMAIAMNDEKTTRTTFQKSVAILKPKADNINSKFLFHLLTSKLLHFNNISAGAAQKNLLLRDIRSLKIKFPTDVSEQIKVSNGCDFMREKTNHLVNYYKNKNNEINLLRQSILQQAFNGELVKD